MKRIIEHIRAEWYKYVMEIIVLIIGVYGAFALDNWNDNRKRKNIERAFLTDVLDDLKTDSAQFAYYHQEFLDIEELHIQLYRIGIKNEMLDSINDPLLIRRSLYFEHLIGKDFLDRAESISTPLVRKEMVSYAKLMAELEETYHNELMVIVRNKLRPYLGEKMAYNTETWFDLKMIDKNDKLFKDRSLNEFEGKNILNKEVLLELSKIEAFQQILFEVNLKWNEFDAIVKKLVKANLQARKTIQQELKSK